MDKPEKPYVVSETREKIIEEALLAASPLILQAWADRCGIDVNDERVQEANKVGWPHDYGLFEAGWNALVRALQNAAPQDAGVGPSTTPHPSDAASRPAVAAPSPLSAARRTLDEEIEDASKPIESLAGQAIDLTIELLREIARRSPDVLKHTDIEAFILNELNPAKVMANKDRRSCYGLMGLLAKARASVPSSARALFPQTEATIARLLQDEGEAHEGPRIALPVRLEHFNESLGDTGDFIGHTRILDSAGVEIAHWCDADDEKEEIAAELVKRLNGAPRSEAAAPSTLADLIEKIIDPEFCNYGPSMADGVPRIIVNLLASEWRQVIKALRAPTSATEEKKS